MVIRPLASISIRLISMPCWRTTETAVSRSRRRKVTLAVIVLGFGFGLGGGRRPKALFLEQFSDYAQFGADLVQKVRRYVRLARLALLGRSLRWFPDR